MLDESRSSGCEGICRSTVLGEQLSAGIKLEVAKNEDDIVKMDEWSHQAGQN